MNQQGDTPAVLCRGLRKVYDGKHGVFRKKSPDVVAVDGLDLAIQRGECFGLLGPNGSGKTTTVEMLEGLLPPSAGQVELLGLRWSSDEDNLRQRVGVALQETNLPDKLMVEELLTLFRSFYRRPRPLDHLLADVELEEKRRAWVGKLSGGQRQRLAIACAMVGEPEVLFLDEPTTGLDPQSRRQVWGLVAGYRARGGTVVLTTHYMEEAERLCDRVAIVDHGKLVRLGTPAELIAALSGDHVIELEIENGGSAGLCADDLRGLPSDLGGASFGRGRVVACGARTRASGGRGPGPGRKQGLRAGTARHAQGIARGCLRGAHGKAPARWLMHRTGARIPSSSSP